MDGLSGNLGFASESKSHAELTFVHSKFKIRRFNSHRWVNNAPEEYMTVIGVDDAGSFVAELCQNYPIVADRSYIFDHFGNIRHQKYGYGHFIDEHGLDWSRQ